MQQKPTFHPADATFPETEKVRLIIYRKIRHFINKIYNLK